ncbi:MAG: histidine kinase [Zetaproteobacteria bacterium CG12_big_fil_rev_8_21_14_0_65_54_13]|nr:MAG: histidine kinase [Zetaproteobacteria bacterium CG23_combo_of_CG06-09_8_20_14_all_54_7]PIW51394.1 MAG: histidine kinase [Zetaproteobacteria bacterium CG12_big_fil_rev_8_21_14_0_65_54_13]PIX54900.1 MAG: histidine kinase [Zetaproteobacteria bacterium CG_4_10_14_3_um_filter_54_28]PJA30367.1 MAG: histidine kinase [Zetaproteobacteria bacterium CG_4_9_14_3_um_filter_54_145]
MAAIRVRYQTLEFDNVDIHLRTLRDNQEFSDDDGIAEGLGISSATWPLFGIVWPSGQVLAHLMADYQIAGKRILEVGCGIALSSLVLNHRHADITATDYHPEAGAFLLANTKLNADQAIPFLRTGWEDDNHSLGKFDLIIGSDLLYEQGHAEMLSGFIDNHANPHCEVIIVDPGRGRHARFSKAMVKLGYAHSQSRPENIEYLEIPLPKGQVLHYLR